MDPLVHTRDQGTIETVDFTRRRAPKKVKTVLSAGKVMATVFWDSQGVIYIDYLEKGKTITGLHYAEILVRFDAELQKTAPFSEEKNALPP